MQQLVFPVQKINSGYVHQVVKNKATIQRNHPQRFTFTYAVHPLSVTHISLPRYLRLSIAFRVIVNLDGYGQYIYYGIEVCVFITHFFVDLIPHLFYMVTSISTATQIQLAMALFNAMRKLLLLWAITYIPARIHHNVRNT